MRKLFKKMRCFLALLMALSLCCSAGEALAAEVVLTNPADAEAMYQQYFAQAAVRLGNFQMVYEMGQGVETIDGAMMLQWALKEPDGRLVFDQNGNLGYDINQILVYLNYLNSKYQGIARTKTVAGKNGALATISYDTNCQLDAAAETIFLVQSAHAGTSGLRAQTLPSGSRNQVTGLGNTYVEIDMTNQMLYYYIDGALFTSTKIVTGNMSKNYNTPETVCSLYAKQRNRILRGADYESFVNYWMPVYGNIGMHDATWRRSFGGEIYQRNGSHGCINMPLEQAQLVYDNIQIGTPVIMYY